jgi:hypothetical protein
MSTKDHKDPSAVPDVHQTTDEATRSTKSDKSLFSIDLLGKHVTKDVPSTLPSFAIVKGEFKHSISGFGKALDKEHPGLIVLAESPVAGKAKDVPAPQSHHFKPFKLPNGQIENTGYIPDSPAELAKIPLAPPSWGPFQAASDGSSPSPKGDVTKWSGSTEMTINSGAGSRAQLFNVGPRIEHTVTIPPAVAPPEVPTPAASAPSADAPQPQPYSGPGSRARLFREQPRN